MQLPLTDPETLFEDLLQDLPAETVQMARACKAFVRAKKVKTPEHLLRVVLFYGGLDKPLREVAGILTALYASMTAQAVAERLRACGPWRKAMRQQRLPMATVESLPTRRRFVVIDASSRQAPGVTGRSSIAARRVNTRVCQWQPNGMLSRGTHAYPGANGGLSMPYVTPAFSGRRLVFLRWKLFNRILTH